MPNQVLFVDLPNFYSHLLETKIEEPRVLRDYFLYWLDFDRLAEKLTQEYSTVWIFYSGRRFGRKPNRIEDTFLDDYVKRINFQRGVTARDVNIPGTQREPATYKCEKCKHEGVAQWESEKGIDASLTVHLFDTMDAWEVAYLLSGDADFVPVVASLRRRGKIVIGAGFSDASLALVRECYDYIDLFKTFLKDDIATYKLFRDDGVIKKWLAEEVKYKSDGGFNGEPVELTFEWQFHLSDFMTGGTHLLGIDEISKNGPFYLIYLLSKGPIDLSSRHEQIEEFRTKFPNQVGEIDLVGGKYQLIISPLGWNGVQRRLENFISSLNPSEKYEGRLNGQGYIMKYQYNSDTNKYKMVAGSD